MVLDRVVAIAMMDYNKVATKLQEGCEDESSKVVQPPGQGAKGAGGFRGDGVRASRGFGVVLGEVGIRCGTEAGHVSGKANRGILQWKIKARGRGR